MGGIGEILGWLSSLTAVNSYRASGGGETRVEAENVGYFPATTWLFVFVLWLLQFMLPVVILSRIFGMRDLTLRGANAQAVLLLAAPFGHRVLQISTRALELSHNGRTTLELPLNRIAGVEIVETWLTQGIVIHSSALPAGRLHVWVMDPAAVAMAVQRAAATGEEAK